MALWRTGDEEGSPARERGNEGTGGLGRWPGVQRWSAQSGWLPGLCQQIAQDVMSGKNLQPGDADLISFETREAGFLP